MERCIGRVTFHQLRCNCGATAMETMDTLGTMDKNIPIMFTTKDREESFDKANHGD